MSPLSPSSPTWPQWASTCFPLAQPCLCLQPVHTVAGVLLPPRSPVSLKPNNSSPFPAEQSLTPSLAWKSACDVTLAYLSCHSASSSLTNSTSWCAFLPRTFAHWGPSPGMLPPPILAGLAVHLLNLSLNVFPRHILIYHTHVHSSTSTRQSTCLLVC